MAGARVLIVSGDIALRRSLRQELLREGFDVRVADSGEEALTLAERRLPDVIVLDLDLAGMSGADVCSELRRWTQVPILALSSICNEMDIVRVLDLGADDLLTKPVGLEEIAARVRVALRHAAGARIRPEITLGDGELRVDFRARKVWRGEKEIALTPREYDVLKYLAQHRDLDVPSCEIVRGVWGLKRTEERRLRRCLPHLQRKIEVDPDHPRYLLSNPELGVRLCP